MASHRYRPGATAVSQGASMLLLLILGAVCCSSCGWWQVDAAAPWKGNSIMRRKIAHLPFTKTTTFPTSITSEDDRLAHQYNSVPFLFHNRHEVSSIKKDGVSHLIRRTTKTATLPLAFMNWVQIRGGDEEYTGRTGSGSGKKKKRKSHSSSSSSSSPRKKKSSTKRSSGGGSNKKATNKRKRTKSSSSKATISSPPKSKAKKRSTKGIKGKKRRTLPSSQSSSIPFVLPPVRTEEDLSSPSHTTTTNKTKSRKRTSSTSPSLAPRSRPKTKKKKTNSIISEPLSSSSSTNRNARKIKGHKKTKKKRQSDTAVRTTTPTTDLEDGHAQTKRRQPAFNGRQRDDKPTVVSASGSGKRKVSSKGKKKRRKSSSLPLAAAAFPSPETTTTTEQDDDISPSKSTKDSLLENDDKNENEKQDNDEDDEKAHDKISQEEEDDDSSPTTSMTSKVKRRKTKKRKRKVTFATTDDHTTTVTGTTIATATDTTTTIVIGTRTTSSSGNSDDDNDEKLEPATALGGEIEEKEEATTQPETASESSVLLADATKKDTPNATATVNQDSVIEDKDDGPGEEPALASKRKGHDDHEEEEGEESRPVATGEAKIDESDEKDTLESSPAAAGNNMLGGASLKTPDTVVVVGVVKLNLEAQNISKPLADKDSDDDEDSVDNNVATSAASASDAAENLSDEEEEMAQDNLASLSSTRPTGNSEAAPEHANNLSAAQASTAGPILAGTNSSGADEGMDVHIHIDEIDVTIHIDEKDLYVNLDGIHEEQKTNDDSALNATISTTTVVLEENISSKEGEKAEEEIEDDTDEQEQNDDEKKGTSGGAGATSSTSISAGVNDATSSVDEYSDNTTSDAEDAVENPRDENKEDHIATDNPLTEEKGEEEKPEIDVANTATDQSQQAGEPSSISDNTTTLSTAASSEKSGDAPLNASDDSSSDDDGDLAEISPLLSNASTSTQNTKLNFNGGSLPIPSNDGEEHEGPAETDMASTPIVVVDAGDADLDAKELSEDMVVSSPSVAVTMAVTPTPSPKEKKNITDLLLPKDHRSDMTISIVTWNLAEDSPAEEEAHFFRQFRGSDLVLISGQECENIKPRRSEGHRSREYRRLMVKMLGKRYIPLGMHMLGGIQFGLFCKRSVLDKIEFVNIADVTCGIGNVFHNKGAIAAFVQVKASKDSSVKDDTKPRSKSLRMLFITAHMAAHVKNSEARDADFWRIVQELEAQAPPRFLPPNPAADGNEPSRTSQSSGGSGSYLLDSMDRVFFCGDLNYRINLPREEAEHAIEQMKKSSDKADKIREQLLRHDQLLATMAEGNAFNGLAEGKVAFLPTFKFDKGTDEYDTSHKQRIPAWTDRIVYKPTGTRLLKYDSVPAALHSDHRPVFASFRVNTFGRELPPTRKRKRKRQPLSARDEWAD